MISVEVNFLCDGLNGDCDECYTTEPGNFDLQEHISEAAVDGGWRFNMSATGQLQCLCYGCQLLMEQAKAQPDPTTVLRRKQQ